MGKRNSWTLPDLPPHIWHNLGLRKIFLTLDDSHGGKRKCESVYPAFPVVPDVDKGLIYSM